MKKKQKIFGWNIDEPKSKTEMILSHLINKRKIDTWTAFTMYKATRLSAVIHTLRKRFNILSKDVVDSNDGRKNYVIYVYKGVKDVD